MSYLRKPGPVPGASGAGGPIQPCPFWKDFPALWEYMSSGSYPDGSPRQTSSLTVFIEDGLIKLCLSDRDNSQTAWGASDEFEDALLGLEKALAGGVVQWRRKPAAANPPRPKKG